MRPSRLTLGRRRSSGFISSPVPHRFLAGDPSELHRELKHVLLHGWGRRVGDLGGGPRRFMHVAARIFWEI